MYYIGVPWTPLVLDMYVVVTDVSPRLVAISHHRSHVTNCISQALISDGPYHDCHIVILMIFATLELTLIRVSPPRVNATRNLATV